MCPRTFPRLAGGGVVAGGEPLSFLLCVVAAGVSCCRVVGLVGLPANRGHVVELPNG